MTMADTDTLRRWLLRQLPPAQTEALEVRLFDDDATQDGSFAAALREAEHDLVDDYAGGRLGEEERTAFERHLLQTAGDRWRLAFARALARKAKAASPTRHADRQRHAAAPARAARQQRRRLVFGGALAASFALALFVLSGIRPHPRVSAPDSMATTAATTQTIALLASAQRGPGEQEIRIDRAATQVRLQAEVTQPPPGGRYSLHVADGAQVVFAADELPLQQTGPYRYVEVTLPANLFGSGARQISVQPQGSEAGAAFVWNLRTTFGP